MKIRTVVKFSLIFALVLILILGTILVCNTQIALAVVPINYVESVNSNEYDWYFGEDYLNLLAVKSEVEKWFLQDTVFNFSALEEDPIVVAIIDTGINFNHEIFEGKYDEYGNPTSCEIGDYDVFLRDESGNIISKNTYNTSKDASNDAPDMHGTHVAGMISILIHELNLEKYVKILPIKASYPKDSSSSTFTLNAVKNAVAFAIEKGADVVNMSLSTKSDADFGNIITDEYANKAVFVAAAGNESVGVNSNSTKYYPAAAQNVIGVMNYTRDTSTGDIVLATKSNYGSAYDLVAPGTDIYSADGSGEDCYKSLTGTSMASPIVAFGAALATLKYRAMIGTELGVNEIAQVVREATSTTIEKSGVTLSVFDMTRIADMSTLNASKIVVNTGTLTQTINQVGEISLSFEVLPSEYHGLGVVNWYIVNADNSKTHVGEGYSITYTPTNEIGTTTILAQWNYLDYQGVDSVQVSVAYEKLDASKISFKKDLEEGVGTGGVYENDTTITYAIKGNENASPTIKVFWYVNGVYQRMGNSFTIVPSEVGYHTISVKINNVEIDVDSFEVKSYADAKLSSNEYKGMLASVSLVSTVVLVTLLTVGAIALSKKLKKKNAQ